MYLPSIDKIKYLYHHKGIKNKRKMPRIHLSCIKHCLIIIIAVDLMETAATNCSTNYTIMPFVLRVFYIKGITVKRISILWNEILTIED